MENSRDDVHSFMTRFEQHEIEFQHTISREIEPHLKYLRVDRYAVNQLSSELLRDLMSLTDIHNDIEIYFAFGYLCIGYCEKDYGNSMRLDAFVPGQLVDLTDQADKAFVSGQLQDHTDQADKDFVTPVLSAAAEIQDKAMGVL